MQERRAGALRDALSPLPEEGCAPRRGDGGWGHPTAPLSSPGCGLRKPGAVGDLHSLGARARFTGRALEEVKAAESNSLDCPGHWCLGWARAAIPAREECFVFQAHRSHRSSILPMQLGQHPRQVQGSPQSSTTAVSAKILLILRRFSQPRGNPYWLGQSSGHLVGLSRSVHLPWQGPARVREMSLWFSKHLKVLKNHQQPWEI